MCLHNANTTEIVKKACQLWNGDRAVQFLAQRENIVYRINKGDTSYVLRLHNHSYHSREQIKSELLLLQQLSQCGLQVPVPIMNRHGDSTAEIDGVVCSVLSFLNGEHLNLSCNAHTFKLVGAYLAQLHHLCDQWHPPPIFQRMHWNIAGITGKIWGHFTNNPLVTHKHNKALVKAIDICAQRIQNNSGLDYGLIHADIIAENLLISNQQCKLIDFDDCGYGYRIFELATLLLKIYDRQDYELCRHNLIQSYCRKRPIDYSLLNEFIFLRSLTYIGWIAKQPTDRNTIAKSRRYISRTTDLANDIVRNPIVKNL